MLDIRGMTDEEMNSLDIPGLTWVDPQKDTTPHVVPNEVYNSWGWDWDWRLLDDGYINSLLVGATVIEVSPVVMNPFTVGLEIYYREKSGTILAIYSGLNFTTGKYVTKAARFSEDGLQPLPLVA